MKTIKIDVINLFAVLLILMGFIFLFGYYILSQIDSCTEDPLNYYIEEIKQSTDAEGVVGVISIIKNNRAVSSQTFGEFSFDGSSEYKNNYDQNNFSIPKLK